MAYRHHQIIPLLTRINYTKNLLIKPFIPQSIITYVPKNPNLPLNFKCFGVTNLTTEIEIGIKKLIFSAKCIGAQSLAFNQIKESRHRIFIMARELDKKNWINRDFKDSDYRVCINPKIIEKSVEKISGWEYCASFPNIKTYISRSKEILVSYMNHNFEMKIKELNGIDSIVFQHEYDHLDGIHFFNIDEMPKFSNIFDTTKVDYRDVQV